MRRFGLLGFPLGHSFSPAFFQEKFLREAIADANYELFELPDLHEFSYFLLKNSDLEGFNVTIPYKERILPYLDELDESALEVGAVNCVRILRNAEKKHLLIGYNTDVSAFEQTLMQNWELPRKALVFGTGGAAKAVVSVLKKLRIDYLQVSRSQQGDEIITYAELNDNILIDRKLWINATPVGMFPDVDSMLPINENVISAQHYLYDLVYNPSETTFLQAGVRQHAHVKNGLPMLHLQADLSWQIWNP